MDFPPLLKNPARADLTLLVSGCAKPRATKRLRKLRILLLAEGRELIKSSGDFHLIQLMFEYLETRATSKF